MMPIPRDRKSLIVHGTLLLLLALAAACLVSLGGGRAPAGRKLVALRHLSAAAGPDRVGRRSRGRTLRGRRDLPGRPPQLAGRALRAGRLLGGRAGRGAGHRAGAGHAGVWILPATAFAGALVTILLVYALAQTPGGGVAPAQTLLLSGVVVSAVLGSLLMFVVSLAPSQELHNVVWWLLGSLQVFDWGLLRVVAAVVAAGLAVGLLFARDLNLMVLGEEPAAHLGLDVERSKKLFFLLASLMTGATVATCGLIGFVGLIVPHGVRLLAGPDHRRLLPAAALAGAAFLVLADSLARTIVAPAKCPSASSRPCWAVRSSCGCSKPARRPGRD